MVAKMKANVASCCVQNVSFVFNISGNSSDLSRYGLQNIYKDIKSGGRSFYSCML